MRGTAGSIVENEGKPGARRSPGCLLRRSRGAGRAGIRNDSVLRCAAHPACPNVARLLHEVATGVNGPSAEKTPVLTRKSSYDRDSPLSLTACSVHLPA